MNFRDIQIKKLTTINGCSSTNKILDATLYDEDNVIIIVIDNPTMLIYSMNKCNGIYIDNGKEYIFSSTIMWSSTTGKTFSIKIK